MPCLGPGINKRTGKKVTECVFITYEGFSKYLSYRKIGANVEWLSQLAEDFVKTITRGRIDLKKFEL